MYVHVCMLRRAALRGSGERAVCHAFVMWCGVRYMLCERQCKGKVREARCKMQDAMRTKAGRWACGRAVGVGVYTQ